MDTIAIKTTGMHCGSCSNRVEMSVRVLPGVQSVTASVEDSLTTVTYDPASVDADTIAEEIRKTGYSAEIPA